MYASRNEYDRGVNTFSPEGRLFQVEYALGAVKLGATAIGVTTKEGVLLATEKRMGSILMEATEDLQKIVEIDTHVACASAGIIADARTLVDHARVEAQNHRFSWTEPIPVETCVDAISDLALDFSGVNQNRKKVMSRPFGVSLLVAGYDEHDGPSLWCTDPSGTNVRYKAASIGSAYEGAESALQERYKEDMSLEEAEVLALSVLRQVMEDKLSEKNIEISSVLTSTGKLHHYTVDEIAAIIQRLPPPQAWEQALNA
eukprot:Blabericola_migrator_1__1052@NODE_1269_length_4935_cov_145_462818_g856_i0_p3_GENE_NODE_1269_length_4935_cov_145_462818_g856_i0NODE_1269_length_4935_cov_145_462818_g856_i0_p3_ORF_typecomplete_len258_score46_85Proteasome/PF00227_26/1_1e50Proteasome_A_N/PF10584_9/6_2e13DUF4194/PF13835_6/0_049SCAB_CC/PF16712_5/0_13SCAB_CC/PF16712_5/1_8e03_NODE_1269_length_4935_cov_145_462818_g856_i021472920